MSRIIGLTHRVKKTAEGEARPTLVLIREPGKPDRALKLEEEADEYDFFVLGWFPIGYRDVVPGEDLSQFLARQLQTRKNKETKEEEVTKVPIVFDGLRPGDTVAMPLGGSGDYLAYAIARKALELGSDTRLWRLKPSILKAKRGDEPKDQDHLLLANLAEREPLLFQPVEVKDLNLIRLKVAFRSLTDTMKARIACEQRLYQLVIGQVFVQAGDCPEGDIKKAYDKLKTTDPGLQALIQHEETCEREMKVVLREIPVYRKVFEPIKGVGPRIAARLISSIGDVRLFETAAKLKAFCGVHVTPDGRFVRRRAGEVANWHPDARQALYLLADQFNRRPDSEWGQKLREYKVKFREKYPTPIIAAGRLVDLYRKMKVLFWNHGVKLDPEGFEVRTIDGLYSWYEACRGQLEERTESPKFAEWDEFFHSRLHEVLGDLRHFFQKWNALREPAKPIRTSTDLIVWFEVSRKDLPPSAKEDPQLQHWMEVIRLHEQVNEGRPVSIYSAGHIHKMACWRTVTKFTERLWQDWTALESAA